MFEETEFVIENLQRPLIDVDVTESGSWVGVTGYLESEYTREPKIPFGTHIHFGDKFYDLPKELRLPSVRSINEEMALVRGMSKQYDENDQRNAWIINCFGEVKINFFSDYGVEDIIVTKDFIVVTQFDERAIGGDGVCVYDFEGNRLFNYSEVFGAESVSVADCYAAAFVKENQIIFCPYTEFPLVIFDIEDKTQEVWQTPAAVHGFSAITKLDEKIFFHRSYRDKFGIYEWQIGRKESRKVGEYQNHFTRGLPNGRFLARTDSGYAIISLQ